MTGAKITFNHGKEKKNKIKIFIHGILGHA